MKEIILTLIIGLNISLFAEDFKDAHIKCTLEYKDIQEVTQREAEGLNEYKMDILISKTTLTANNEIFKYIKREGKEDIFMNNKFDYYEVMDLYDDISFKVYKKLLEEKYHRRYECRKATLFEKIKYKFSK